MSRGLAGASLFASCLAAALAAASDDPLRTRADLKDVAKKSARAISGRQEATKHKAGVAFGDERVKAKLKTRGMDPATTLQPGALAPGTPDSTGGPVKGLTMNDSPTVGASKNVTPYQADLDRAASVIRTNSYRLVAGAEHARNPLFAGTGRLSALSTLIIGVIIGIVGAMIGKMTGQTLQGSLITAVGAFLGSTALMMIAGGKPDPERLREDIPAAGAPMRTEIRKDFSKAGGRVADLDDSGSGSAPPGDDE
ncbi:MAG: hypothetical protein HY553_01345 [Elusimicrobia bacterium]|nr:hypothetical protein [Elusimicrobiota bacterium]